MLQVFQLFQTYVASVLSACCKSKSDVAHVTMCAVHACEKRRDEAWQGGGCGKRRRMAVGRGWSPPVRAAERS
jgi:hypothetical protein